MIPDINHILQEDLLMTIQDLKKRIKSATLDKTNFDERAMNVLNQSKQGYKIGMQNLKNAYKQDPTRFNVFSQNNLKRQSNLMDAVGQRYQNPVVKAGSSFSKSFIDNYQSGFKNIGEGLKERSPGKVAVGAWKTASPSLAMSYGPLKVATNAVVGGAVNAGVAKVTGRDPSKAFGNGAFEAGRLTAVTGATNPRIDRMVGSIGGGLLKKQVGQRVTSGLLNVGEDELIARLDGVKNTNPERFLSLVIGMASAGNVELSQAIKNKISSVLHPKAKSRLKPQQVQQVAQEVSSYIRDSRGRFAKKANEKISLAVGSGRNMNANRALKWIRTPDGLKRVYADNNEQLSAVSGLLGGIEPQRDENGRLKLSYNPTKGAIGVGVMAGIKKLPREEALKQLRHVLTDGNDLRAIGFKPKQIEKINVKQSKEILEKGLSPEQWFSTISKENIPLTAKQAIQVDAKPSKNLDIKKPLIDNYNPDQIAGDAYLAELEGQDLFKKSFAKWIGQRDVAKTTATQKASKFASVPSNIAWDVVKATEGTYKGSDTQVKQTAKLLKSEYDNLFADAKSSGVDLNYLKNYVTHIWEEPIQEVQQKFLSAMGKFKYKNERVLPTYDEGIKLGLTPKYSNPAQILEAYAQNLEKAKANVTFLNELKDQGLIVSASVAKQNPGFKPILAPGLGDNQTRLGDNSMLVGHWYAPESVANTINKVFDEPQQGFVNKATDVAGNISGKIQDITMSGGLPGTPVNAFSLMAGLQREFLAGRIVDPVKSFLTSFSPKASQQFFQDNIETVKKMQKNNIPMSTDFKIENMIDQPTIKKFGWDKLMNDPTFSRFMPQLQVRLFNEIEQSALSIGKSPIEAEELASQAVKNFYGVITSDAQALRSKLSKDTSKTLFFAPKYRESIINFWGNTLKSSSPLNIEFNRSGASKVVPSGVKLNNPFSIQNKYNTRFLLGATLSYVAMDQLNKHLNGHGMSENPQGKQDKLLIPAGDTTIGVPWLSSLGTLPRGIYRQSKALVSGNPQEASKDAMSTYASSLIKPFAEIATNQDYFGKQIYDPNDETGQKLLSQGQHLIKSYNHPYIREGLNVVSENLPISDQSKKKLGINLEKTPTYQTASKALELPFRFYKTDSIKNAPFWDAYNRNKSIAQRYQEMKYNDPQRAIEFLGENGKAISEYEKQKAYVSEYYNQNKNSKVLQSYGGGSDTSYSIDFLKEKNKLGMELSNEEFNKLYKSYKRPHKQIIEDLKEGKIKKDQAFVVLGQIDLPSPKEPKLGNSNELNKKLISAYKGEVTSAINDIVSLYEVGYLSEEQADKAINNLTTRKNIGSKKTKKIKISSSKKTSISSVIRPTNRSIKLSKIELPKIQSGSLTIKPTLQKKRVVKLRSRKNLARISKINLAKA